jgi:hypothetical protein
MKLSIVPIVGKKEKKTDMNPNKWNEKKEKLNI